MNRESTIQALLSKPIAPADGDTAWLELGLLEVSKLLEACNAMILAPKF